MIQQSLVSIILPFYNSQKFLDASIKSIINQTHKNWELILINDGSSDSSLNIAKKYLRDKRLKLISYGKNKGPAYSRNLGIKESRGEYICFLDSDDLWEREKLKTQIIFMKKKNIELSCTNYQPFSENKTLKEIKPKNNYNFERFIYDTSICTSTMMIKKRSLKNIKFFQGYKFDDYIFKCFLLKKNRFFTLNKNLVKYRIRSNSVSSNKIENFFDVWKINKRIFKLNFFKNLFCLISISYKSLKKYN